MKIQMNLKFLFLTTLILLLTSCATTNNTTLFGNFSTKQDLRTNTQTEPIINNNDLLEISIWANDPLSITLFNNSKCTKNNLNHTNLDSNLTSTQLFLVDNNGYISLPLLGNIKIAGMKKSDAVNLITTNLLPYIKKPIVTIRLCNFQITILGEVNKPGVYTTINERMNILEALGLAGYITKQGCINNILLIRNIGQENEKFIQLDLSDINFISSPYFHLQSNDILYIQHK
jgi:polysaccharide export outer membrane protein